MADPAARLEQLQAKLDDLRARLPAHSPRPSMMLELEDLEEQIEALRDQSKEDAGDEQG